MTIKIKDQPSEQIYAHSDKSNCLSGHIQPITLVKLKDLLSKMIGTQTNFTTVLRR